MYYSTLSALQVITPSYWVVALIINIPCVMITEVHGTTGECRELWSKEWGRLKAYRGSYSSLAFL